MRRFGYRRFYDLALVMRAWDLEIWSLGLSGLASVIRTSLRDVELGSQEPLILGSIALVIGLDI